MIRNDVSAGNPLVVIANREPWIHRPAGGRPPRLARRASRYPVALLLGCLLIIPGCAKGSIGTPRRPRDTLVTPVEGPSWVKHLGLSVSETHLGHLGGTQAAPGSARSEPDISGKSFGAAMHRYMMRVRRGEAGEFENESFTLAGADLYRLNCQSCHGPDGNGAPPEINSLIGPVQATSAASLMERMKTRGTPIPESMAKDLAAGSEKDLRDRLQNGGKKMPPFRHLRGDEVEALLGYLERLAGLPPSARSRMLVPQSSARVGEHVVKGTCHICHDATGPGGGHVAMMSGIIPSLASFPQQQSLDSVILQVQNGSSGMMQMMGGPQMPPFPYLTKEEIAAAYFYLAHDPPRP